MLMGSIVASCSMEPTLGQKHDFQSLHCSCGKCDPLYDAVSRNILW